MGESQGTEAPACPLHQPGAVAIAVLHWEEAEIPPGRGGILRTGRKIGKGATSVQAKGKAANSVLYCNVEAALLLMTAELGGLLLKNPY